jgi:nucleoside-diphosphate-sugar epimerase
VAPPSVGHNVLVTGAAGFIGANLVGRALADGHDVTALVRPGGTGWRLDEVREHIQIVEVDVLDAIAVKDFLQRARPRWVFHLAAHGAYSWQNNARQIADTNFVATVNLVEAASAAGCEAFVQAGSSSEYGFKDHAPDENELPEPNSVYAATKVAAGMYCQHVARRDGLRAVTLRLYSIYGAFEDPRRLIPTLITRGLRNELPPLVEADVARDFVAVDDAVEAFVLAASIPTLEPGAVYNVGSGTQTTVGETVELARRTLHITAEPDWGSAKSRDWDATVWRADTRKIRAELGWSPRLDLQAGFERTVAWLQGTPEVWDLYGVRARDRTSMVTPDEL